MPGEFVLIMGLGPIGLASLVFAKQAGAKIIAMDIENNRLQFCGKVLNADHVVNALDKDVIDQLLQITGGDMPTVVIDATGNLNGVGQFGEVGIAAVGGDV